MLRSRNNSSKPRKSSVFTNYMKSMYSAFKYDTETFLEKFEKEKSFNYADFANIWQSMDFTFVFADQNYVKLLKILCEICFLITKKYIMFQSNQYIQMGAFYLLYGLYYKQPIQSLVNIRLTLDEYRKLKNLMNEMETKGQYDALYIFAKMKSDGAFLFVAYSKELGILSKPNAYMDADDTFSQKGYENSFYKFENLLKDETTLALEKTCNEYEAKLKEFTERNPGILPHKSTICKDLEQAYQNVMHSRDSFDPEEEPVAETVSENTRQTIRQKAMENKNAQYRGTRKVITSLDLKEKSESE